MADLAVWLVATLYSTFLRIQRRVQLPSPNQVCEDNLFASPGGREGRQKSGFGLESPDSVSHSHTRVSPFTKFEEARAAKWPSNRRFLVLHVTDSGLCVQTSLETF